MKKNIKSRILAGMLAVIFTVSFSSCNKGGNNESSPESSSQESSSKAENSSSKTESSISDNTSGTDSSQAEVVQGDKIKKAYEYFTGNEYSFKERITDSSGNAKIITETRKGDDFYRLQETSQGRNGKIKSGDESYEFDYECGIFKKSDDTFPENMIKSVVEKKLPQTSTHIDKTNTEKYDVEEYTYTGSTYITVLDFCFDKKSGRLAKYNVTYQVEGKDDETESREFVYMKNTADEKMLKTDFISKLTDFENLKEDERAQYCKMIIDKVGIGADDMINHGMTTDKLKIISYEDFTDFIYSSKKK